MSALVSVNAELTSFDIFRLDADTVVLNGRVDHYPTLSLHFTPAELRQLHDQLTTFLDDEPVDMPARLSPGGVDDVPGVEYKRINAAFRKSGIEAARDEAAVRNARNFGTDPSWYGR